MDTRLDNVLITPVARLVQGGLKYSPDLEYQTNEQKVYTSGPKKGQLKFCYFLAVAIPKEDGVLWKETQWGKKILHSVHLQIGVERTKKRDFSFKVVDGDLPEHAEKKGFANHWILKFKTSQENLKIFDRYGKEIDKNMIDTFGPKRGDYIKVAGSIYINEKATGPYFAPSTVVFVKPGERIETKEDLSKNEEVMSQLFDGLPPEDLKDDDVYPEILEKALQTSKDDVLDLSNFELTENGKKRGKNIDELFDKGFSFDELIRNGLIVERIAF